MSINEETSKRISSLRIILVLLVICIHNYPSKYIDNNVVIKYIVKFLRWLLSGDGGIPSGAVPAFFVITAYLQFIKTEKYSVLLKKKFKAIIVPYIIWISIYIIMNFLLQIIPNLSGFSVNSSGDIITNWRIIDWIGAYTGYGRESCKPIAAPLWFLRDLIVLIIISPIIKYILDKNKGIELLIITGIIYYCDVSLYFVFPASLFYYCLGAFISNNKYDLFTLSDRFSMLFLTCLYIVCFIIYHLVSNVVYFNGSVLTAFCMLLWFYRLSKHLVVSNRLFCILKKTEKYSFFIYCFHGPFVIAIMNRLWCKFIPEYGCFGIINEILPVFICFFICFFAAVILEKWLPYIYNVLNGSRRGVSVSK